ncbi:MAG: Wzz/FepE/Etk N-terminal domain-containing protein, partial [Chloroflexota bacterium]|nr:Wzz/FepE/Etk N-terminal domain-containing protein [Chloroflexota bacterium]
MSQQSLGDELNMREMIVILLRHKWLIISVTLLATVVAGVVGSLSVNPQYQSKATIQVDRLNLIIALSTISKPEEDVSILLENTPENDITDEDILALLENVPQLVLLEKLARDDKLLAEINHSFGKYVKPTTSSIEDRIDLIATSSDPNTASEYVNLWAKKYVERLNNEYTPDRMVGYLDIYIEALWAKVAAAEESLLDVMSNETVEVKEAELTHAKQSLIKYLTEIEDNEDLLKEIQAFDHILTEHDADVILTTGERIRSVSLHQRAYSDHDEAMTDRYETDYFSDEYPAAQARNDLQVLSTAIENEIDLLETEVDQLESHLLSLAAELNAV